MATVETAIRDLHGTAAHTIGLSRIHTHILIPHERLDVLGDLLTLDVKRVGSR